MMTEPLSKSSFADKLKTWCGAIGFLVLILGQLGNIKKAIGELGWSIVTTVAFLLILLFTHYIFTAKQETQKYKGKKESVYGTKVKLGLVVCCVVAAGLTGYAWLSSYIWTRSPSEMVSTVSEGPPLYPDPAGILDRPTEKQVESKPIVPARDVNLLYRNDSGNRLKLLVYDWYYNYNLLSAPLAPQTPWRTFRFSDDGSYKTFSDFSRGTGWYSFYVEEMTTGKQYFLCTKNIFYSEWPTLTVKHTEEQPPYEIVFDSEDHP